MPWTQLTSEDIECYLEYLSFYIAPDQNRYSTASRPTIMTKGKARKLASVRSMYKYFYKKERSKPIRHHCGYQSPQKKIARFNVNKMANFWIRNLESGNNLTGAKKTRRCRKPRNEIWHWSHCSWAPVCVYQNVLVSIGKIRFSELCCKSPAQRRQ